MLSVRSQTVTAWSSRLVTVVENVPESLERVTPRGVRIRTRSSLLPIHATPASESVRDSNAWSRSE